MSEPGLPAYGRSLFQISTRPPSRPAVAPDSGFVPWNFVPVTAAGQREIFTPLPWRLFAVFVLFCVLLRFFLFDLPHTSCLLYSFKATAENEKVPFMSCKFCYYVYRC